ncbi:ROK family protein [Paucibacter sp. APW11]|uniref:N-acetylglucosamine kinase n=1 Tax=Roseateles aquae TaxID=3077235 RepID=A0ABU3P926_9BURK|nr:ROK family protein [Paucibacter sp. APW11]MDT8999078.1 ROK family protein [Paucibacter sp. APW11]
MPGLQQTSYGIDVGGSKIELVAYDTALQPLWRKRIATPSESFEAFCAALCGLVDEADAQLGQCAPLGIGLPGLADPQTGLQLSSNVPALRGQPAQTTLAARLDRRIAFGNDCQCFALSEAHGGAAAGYRSMFGAILGTGAGGGFCREGRLNAGRQGVAGEWGHWSLPAKLALRHELPVWLCGCGLMGCLECYVSGRGMARLYQHIAGSAAEPEAQVPRIVALAESGDALATRTLACYLDLLGYGLASLVLALDPEVIVLGGGLSQLGLLYEALPAAIANHLFGAFKAPPILPPLYGDAAGTRGAALLLAD